jgi:DNA-binding MarR family transcriptional regulator
VSETTDQPFRLSPLRRRALLALAEQPAANIRVLAGRICATSPSVSRAVREFRTAGLVSSNVATLSLTMPGLELARQVKQQFLIQRKNTPDPPYHIADVLSHAARVRGNLAGKHTDLHVGLELRQMHVDTLQTAAAVLSQCEQLIAWLRDELYGIEG